MTAPVVACLGELLVRLSAPGCERLLQSHRLDVAYGGAEANVAVMLARLGLPARMGSVVADNAIGAAAISELRSHGVNVECVSASTGRMGLYFLTPAAMSRPAEVLYDRADSAFAMHAEAVDLDRLLEGASWLHLSGITPAVSRAATRLAQEAVQAAAGRGIKVSFDGNYRAQLWQQWQGDGPSVLAGLLEQADLAFINEKDVALITGTPVQSREEAVAAAFKAFPKLRTIAATMREVTSPSVQTLRGEIHTRDGFVHSPTHQMAGIVDRIGAGDAFAAGVLFGLERGLGGQETVDFATVAAVLKHSIRGDFNLITENDVRGLMAGGNQDVRR
ncbi:MAG: sugar kinase [Hyphomonadaceae bacterium]|nr:sugar kinase [Hyphomonadaceae bacterium]